MPPSPYFASRLANPRSAEVISTGNRCALGDRNHAAVMLPRSIVWTPPRTGRHVGNS